MVIRFLRRRPQGAPAVPEVAPAKPPAAERGRRSPLLAVWHGIQGVFEALDRGFTWFAVPFGVRIRDPGRRYAVMLCVFAAIYLLGALPLPWLPLVALGVGY